MIQRSNLFFDLFLLFVRFIEDRSKYYKINIRYTSVLKNLYNDILLYFLSCFVTDTEIMYAFLVYIFFPC